MSFNFDTKNIYRQFDFKISNLKETISAIDQMLIETTQTNQVQNIFLYSSTLELLIYVQDLISKILYTSQ